MSQNIPEDKGIRITEIDAWEQIISSPAWAVYAKLMDEHCNYLQKKVNYHLGIHEDRTASEYLACLNDAKGIKESVRARLEQLRKSIDGKERK